MSKLSDTMDRLPLGTAVVTHGHAFHLMLGELVASPIIHGAYGKMLGGWMRGPDLGLEAEALANALEGAMTEGAFVNLNKYLQDNGQAKVA